MKTFLSENSVFLKSAAVGLAVLVLIFSLPVKAHAESLDFADWRIPYTGIPEWGLQVREGDYLYLESGYRNNVVVCFIVGDTNYYVSPTVLVKGFDAQPTATLSFVTSRYNNATGLYFGTNGFPENLDATTYAPTFESESDGFSAVASYFATNPSPPEEPTGPGAGGGAEPEPETVSNLNYSLPPGNVAFVKLPDDISLFQGVTLRTQMPQQNFLYAPNGQLWASSQRMGFSDSLPTSDFDCSQYTVIDWQKDGDTTIFGATRNAIYSRGPLLISNGYMFIVNPIYYGGTANGPYEFQVNGSVQISAVGVKGITVYALDSSLGFTTQGGITVSSDISGDPFGGEIDAETGEITWTDPSGGTNAPAEGGNNLIPTGETVFDAVKKIASDFADFLKGPISAIRTVVSAITNFLAEFKSLYVWLPGPVYNLITSAIMVALTIGVVKIFV